MKLSKISLFVIIFICCAFSLQAGGKPKFEDFTLKDYNGVEHNLSDYKDSKGIVLMFISTRCPVSNAYNERMAAIANEYHEKGFAFIGINSNEQENVGEIKVHSEKNNFHFVVLKDWENKIADKFEASVTPEIFILNSDFELLYHGRIDDSRRGDNITEHNLTDALDEVFQNKEVTKSETKAFGCTIKRVN